MAKTVVLSLLLVTVAACGTTIRSVPLNPSPRPMYPRPAAEVQVFSTALPHHPYVEVATVQGRQASRYSLHRLPDVIQSMREEAGRYGCDGLVLQGYSDGVDESDGLLQRLEGMIGTCIVFVSHHTGPPAKPAHP